MSNSMKRPPAKHEPKKPPNYARQFQLRLRKADTEVSLARTYYDDGAFASAAGHYRLAAAYLDEANSIRVAGLAAVADVGYKVRSRVNLRGTHN